MYNYFNQHVPQNTLNEMSILVFAHIGDSVYEIMARSYIALKGSKLIKKIHSQTVELVCAEFQSKASKEIIPLLNSDENSVFVRGRNAKPKTIPKNVSHADYSAATGLEALFGWLYLCGRTERLNELFEKIINLKETEMGKSN